MEEIRKKEEKCTYCYKTTEDCKSIMVRTSSRAEWQKQGKTCKSCREYLIGFFKYNNS